MKILFEHLSHWNLWITYLSVLDSKDKIMENSELEN